MESYDYAHRQGVRNISWDEFAGLAARVAEALAAAGVEVVLGIARAGLFPATQVAISLRRELYPVRVTRRIDDQVVFRRPVWRVPVPPAVAGRTVAVIDEIADTGETLALVAGRAGELGAARVLTACLARHTGSRPAPDVCPLVTDELVIFPWDRQVLIDGQWQPHPEIVAARKAQGRE